MPMIIVGPLFPAVGEEGCFLGIHMLRLVLVSFASFLACPFWLLPTEVPVYQTGPLISLPHSASSPSVDLWGSVSCTDFV